jgi:ATP-dependent RNA helicase RhlE
VDAISRNDPRESEADDGPEREGGKEGGREGGRKEGREGGREGRRERGRACQRMDAPTL